jgi:uncharacterized protein YjbI with pentapeptide repeats
MAVEIKHIDGRVLYTAEHAPDVRAAVVEATQARAYLAGAYLAGAYLAGADLAGAYLAGAYLARANLAGAYLAGAKGFDPRRYNDLLILLDQPGKVRAYKLVDGHYRSPIQQNGKLFYRPGETVEAADVDTDPAKQCAAGLNVATLPWCLRWWRDGYRVLLVEFAARDIAAIPVGDGKFRVRKLRVVRELDLADLGLVEAEAQAT